MKKISASTAHEMYKHEDFWQRHYVNDNAWTRMSRVDKIFSAFLVTMGLVMAFCIVMTILTAVAG